MAAVVLPLVGAGLETELQNLARGFDGRVGICAQDRAGVACVNGDQRFSLQSVMKLLVGFAVMDAVDRRGWKLDEPVVIRKRDLSLYVQPIAKLVTAEGYRTTVGDLVRRALVDSDSAAVDFLVAKLGGPPAVQGVLERHGITGMRFDRDERHLQTEIMSVKWRPEFVDKSVLESVFAKQPEAVLDAAYRKYQSDPRDTSTPAAMASFLFRLADGKLLSGPSTRHLLQVMRQTATFPDRLKAGLSDGWTLAHKTGTSGSWKGMTAATNDVGVLTAPDGRVVSVAVFIGDSRAEAGKKAALMAQAARVVIAGYRGR